MPVDPYPGYPSPNTLADAAKLRAQLNSLYLAANPAARVYHNASQSIPNNTYTALAFNSERFDNDTIHDTATNNSRLTCKTAGVYLITGTVTFDTTGGGASIREATIGLNGSTTIAVQMEHAAIADFVTVNISTLYKLAVNDYVQLSVRQTQGAAINVNVVANYSPEFAMNWVGIG